MLFLAKNQVFVKNPSDNSTHNCLKMTFIVQSLPCNYFISVA